MGRRTKDLPNEIGDLLRGGGGVLRTATAKDAGIEASRLRRLTSAGLLTRLARGSYVATRELDRLDDWQRFALRARAFALSCGPDAYLTGWASTVMHELPTLGRPPKRATVVRPKAHGRGATTRDHARILVADLPAEHRMRIGRLGIMSEAWSVADLARTARLPHSLVVADAALRRGTDLSGVLPHMSRWPGVHRLHWVAKHADPAAETPLETLGRFACIEFGLPMFVANAWVGHNRLDGGPEKRVDGLLPWHWSVLEGDGALKYDNRDDASMIVRAQNDREFYLRRVGLDFVRFGWPDVYPRRDPLAARLRALLADNPARSEPVRWWKHVPGVGPVAPSPQDWPSPYPQAMMLPAGWRHALGSVDNTPMGY